MSTSSVQRWHDQHKASSNSGGLGTSTGGHRDGGIQDKTKISEAMSEEASKEASKEVSKEATGEESEGEEEEDGSAYSLVVERSKAIEGGRRFELPCGSNVVVGRSQHRAGIVVKDELVGRGRPASLDVGADLMESADFYLCLRVSLVRSFSKLKCMPFVDMWFYSREVGSMAQLRSEG